MTELDRRAATEDAVRRGVPSGQDDDDQKFAASRSFYGNEGLWTLLNFDEDGRIVFHEGGGGFNDFDGALGIKWPWFRVAPGLLAIGGRRLDAEAPPARAYIFPYGLSGFQPSELVFPTPGCWEITGGVADYRLTFVVAVEKIGSGPQTGYDSPLGALSAGRYYTNRADQWGVTPWTRFLEPEPSPD
jgi:hypothetical protein